MLARFILFLPSNSTEDAKSLFARFPVVNMAFRRLRISSNCCAATGPHAGIAARFLVYLTQPKRCVELFFPAASPLWRGPSPLPRLMRLPISAQAPAQGPFTLLLSTSTTLAAAAGATTALSGVSPKVLRSQKPACW